MTNPMRPGPPHAAPRGQRWVPTYVDDADPAEAIEARGDRKCQRQSGVPYKVNPCNAGGAARVTGTWLCTNHLREAGMWVDAGIVLKWELEEIDNAGD